MATDLELKTLYTNDVDVSIEVDCETDVSGAYAWQIIIQSPDGTNNAKDAIPVPGSSESIRCNVVADDFQSEGIYRVKAEVDFGSGHVQQGAVDRIRVKESWT